MCLCKFFLALHLLRGAFVVSFFECLAGTVFIKFSGHPYVGDGCAIPAFRVELLVDFLIDVSVKSWCWFESSARSNRVVKSREPTFGLKVGSEELMPFGPLGIHSLESGKFSDAVSIFSIVFEYTAHVV